LDELPAGRQPTKTWLVPRSKRADAWQWLIDHVQNQQAQALVVCPYIDPTQTQAEENITAVSQLMEELQGIVATLPQPPQLGLLHGKLKPKIQAEVIKQLYDRQIQILVTTPIVEVGVDLPQADIMVIEAAERFGLASLHQLRGRVGRGGQQGYCLLYTNSSNTDTKQRLNQFCEITQGNQVAELDLANRGAGDLFGQRQHGFDQLQFADWADTQLITKSYQLFQKLKTTANWQPLLPPPASWSELDQLPLAN
jgi:ATP-dependent DNA helicase RecG